MDNSLPGVAFRLLEMEDFARLLTPDFLRFSACPCSPNSYDVVRTSSDLRVWSKYSHSTILIISSSDSFLESTYF